MRFKTAACILLGLLAPLAAGFDAAFPCASSPCDGASSRAGYPHCTAANNVHNYSCIKSADEHYSGDDCAQGDDSGEFSWCPFLQLKGHCHNKGAGCSWQTCCPTGWSNGGRLADGTHTCETSAYRDRTSEGWGNVPQACTDAGGTAEHLGGGKYRCNNKNPMMRAGNPWVAPCKTCAEKGTRAKAHVKCTSCHEDAALVFYETVGSRHGYCQRYSNLCKPVCRPHAPTKDQRFICSTVCKHSSEVPADYGAKCPFPQFKEHCHNKGAGCSWQYCCPAGWSNGGRLTDGTHTCETSAYRDRTSEGWGNVPQACTDAGGTAEHLGGGKYRCSDKRSALDRRLTAFCRVSKYVECNPVPCNGTNDGAMCQSCTTKKHVTENGCCRYHLTRSQDGMSHNATCKSASPPYHGDSWEHARWAPKFPCPVDGKRTAADYCVQIASTS